MTEKGARPDQPDLAVLLPDPALVRVLHIPPSQASIIVGTGHWGGRHQAHPPPIIGHQWRGTHHGGGPQQRGGVQPPLVGHTHQMYEGGNQGYVRTQRYEEPKPHCIGDGCDRAPYLVKRYGYRDG